MLDVFYEKPDYSLSTTYGFSVSTTDGTTRIFYDFLLIYSQYIFFHFTPQKISDNCKIHNEYDDENTWRTIKQVKINKNILYFFALLPTILAFLLRFNHLILYTPLWRENVTFNMKNFSMLDKTSYIGVVSSVILFFSTDIKRYIGVHRIFAVMCLYINMCIEGKRSIIFFTIICFVLAVIIKDNEEETTKELKKRTTYFKPLMLLGIISIMLYFVVLFTVFVKTNSRGYDLDDFERLYTTIRIDFFRESRIMMELFSLNNPELMSIVKIFGATIIQLPLFLFPVDFISSYFLKYSPVTYTSYLSAALIDYQFPSDVDAFMTPSIWGEIISNFNWLGVIFSPFFFVIFERITEKNKFPYNYILIVCFIAVNMYSLAYMSYLLEFAIIIFLFKETSKHSEILK